MLKIEQTYRSALTNEFLSGVLLNVGVLALTDSGILGSTSCQKALSKGFCDGSPKSLTWGLIKGNGSCFLRRHSGAGLSHEPLRIGHGRSNVLVHPAAGALSGDEGPRRVLLSLIHI